MIRDVCRRLLIWIRFHPVSFALHFIVIFLILCGGIGWVITLAVVISSLGFFSIYKSSVQIEFLVPLTDGEQRRREMIKVFAIALYLNTINVCGTMINIFVYRKLKGDFTVGAGGIGEDLPVLVFWLVLFLLTSLQQGFYLIKDQVSGTLMQQFGEMGIKEKAETVLRFASVLLSVAGAVITYIIERPLSLGFLIRGRTAGNLLMAAILALVLWDVVRLAGQIRKDTV